MGKPFLTDIKERCRRARPHIEEGAVTEAYHADRGTVLRLLNEALATEIVCVLRHEPKEERAEDLSALIKATGQADHHAPRA